ncbi:MAG TPA: lipocalin-like domain-containing protein [Anaerolineaceae bacterium]|nr:lipocalin-like domain-containing protein [Anaerolineaceae bacterium]
MRSVMNKTSRAVVIKGLAFAAVLVVIAVLIIPQFPGGAQKSQAQIVVLPIASGDFEKAIAPRNFVFPSDHGPHPDFQTEWWYYTGNLDSSEGQHFGFELTFFRRALQPSSARIARNSDWATQQVYMAHFTLTDVSSGSFRYFEQLSRGAAGLAGALGQPVFSVWLNNWSVQQIAPDEYHLQSSQQDIRLDLMLKDLKGPILEGDHGYSQKGAEVGNASYYYSETRLQTQGTLTVGMENYQVNGASWMDHEFSTSALSTNEVGWDWYALQLNDGSELMMYSLRHSDGSQDLFSSGTVIYPDGSTRSFKLSDFKITHTTTWRSPHSGAVYPADWTVQIPSENLTLQVQPYLADQELNVSFIYWEGAVKVNGSRAGQALSGSGYVELTGYAASMQGQF